MLDAQNLGNDVQSGQGKPGEGDQVSDPKAQTDPKTQDGPILIDPARKYVLNSKRPDETVFGNVLLSQAGRGKMFDEAQSESQKKDTVIANTAKQLNEALSELQAIKTEQSVRKIMADSGATPTHSQQPPAQGSENDPGLDLLRRLAAQQDEGAQQPPGQDTPTPAVNPATMMLQMQGFFATKLKEMEQQLAASTQATLKEYIQGREEQDQYGTFLRGQSELTARNVASRFPDLDPGSVKNIVDLTAQANLLTSKALQAAQEGDHDTARNLFTQKESFDMERMRLEAEALALQKSLDKKKELKEILEADTTSVFAEVGAEPRKMKFLREEKDAENKAALDRAVKIGDNVEQMNKL